MTSRTFSHHEYFADGYDRTYDAARDDAELVSGERICQPHARSVWSTLYQGAIVLSAIGGGLALYAHPEHMKAWLPVSTTETQQTAAALQAPPLVKAPPADVQPLITTARDIADAPGRDAGIAARAAAAPPPEVAASADLTDTLEEPPAPLPPPTVDPADPYQKRAIAAGLHPDISKAVLKRLTSSDYRNAGVAVRTALAETTDNETYSWPNKPKAKLALFEVHFVKGASSDCRRYVVTISKDGWSTTAPPMEKCGLARPLPRGKAASG